MALFFRIGIKSRGAAAQKVEPSLEPEVGLTSPIANATRVSAVMPVLLVAALLAATSSVIATACIVYILVSLRRSGRLFASRVGRQPMALVLIASETSRWRHLKGHPVATRRHLRLQPQTSA